MNTITTNTEKQEAYRNGYGRLNKALKYEFYLEALSIGYAMIEDRLVAFLHHAGIVSRNNQGLKINPRTYPYMRKLLGYDCNKPIRIKDISVKILLIKGLLSMKEEDARKIDEEIRKDIERGVIKKALRTGYCADLYEQINTTLEKEYLQTLLKDIEGWRNIRNQLIHALLNKTVKSAEQEQKLCAYAEYDFSRDLDDRLVKPFKRGNTLRKRYNIQ